MYEPERYICDVGYWTDFVRTAISILFRGMGTEKGNISDTAGPIPREFSCELEELSANGPQSALLRKD